jgi:hypothetical protein
LNEELPVRNAAPLDEQPRYDDVLSGAAAARAAAEAIVVVANAARADIFYMFFFGKKWGVLSGWFRFKNN